jgi:tetratricopeptide (TPR) repeat protein
MKALALTITCSLALLLGGCLSAPAPRPQATPPAPSAPSDAHVPERDGTASAGSGPTIPASPPAPPRAPSSDATDALVRTSQEASLRGDYRGAIAALERAIRIDGRNADLWARLSVAYLRDGRINPARQYANRATTLAGNRPDWKRAAWLAVAAIEEQVGNQAEADRLRALFPADGR